MLEVAYISYNTGTGVLPDIYIYIYIYIYTRPCIVHIYQAMHSWADLEKNLGGGGRAQHSGHKSCTVT